MHIGNLDLNLLVPLSLLLDERHVSRAAARADMTQPTMSRALKRLRTVLGDELLVRGKDGYVLTPRGERLQQDLLVLMPRLEALFAAEPFDPRRAAETFRLAGSDFAAAVFGPHLFGRIYRASPRSAVTFSGWEGAVLDRLERGSLDLAFFGAAAPEVLQSEWLFDEPFVCVMSADHPLADRRDGLSLEEYLGCAHVVINIADGRQGTVDASLAAIGARRDARLTVPYHSTAVMAAAGTPLVATLPQRLTAPFKHDPTLTVLRTPIQIEHMSYLMIYHPRLRDDPAQRWLRDTVRAVTQSLTTPSDDEASHRNSTPA